MLLMGEAKWESEEDMEVLRKSIDELIEEYVKRIGEKMSLLFYQYQSSC